MSFCSEQKNEIIDGATLQPCCKRALLQGILSAKGLYDEREILLSVDSRKTAEFIAALIHEIFTKTAEISTSEKGGRRVILKFSSPAAIRYLKSFNTDGNYFSEGCAACHSAFLRGIFLVSGRVSDPKKQYLLEFLVPHHRERIIAFFEENGLTPRVSQKTNETLIYFRKSTDIEDFFALAGMNDAMYAIMNEKINSELRNNVNRIINCTTSNIGKAVSASHQQIELIEQLIEKGLISQLPDELEATARLRLQHRDMSLAQLAALITPKISKPGLSHRLKRITELAKELLEIEDDE